MNRRSAFRLVILAGAILAISSLTHKAAAADSIHINFPSAGTTYASGSKIWVEGHFTGNHAHILGGAYNEDNPPIFVYDEPSGPIQGGQIFNPFSVERQLPTVPAGQVKPYYIKGVVHSASHTPTAQTDWIKIYVSGGPALPPMP
jgi:hypothetical protein